MKHTAGGELVSWRRDTVTWTIDPSVKKIKGAEAAIVSAAQAWTEREGAPSIAIGSTTTKLKPGLDDKNAIFYAPGGYEAAGNALAITILSFDDVTGEVVDADIVINGKYKFAPLSAEGDAGAEASEVPSGDATDATFDIGRVMAHEMGHSLGLSDEPSQLSALMYPFVARSRALAAMPGSDDLAGIGTLYSPDAKASEASSAAEQGGCATTPRRNSPIPLTGLAAAGLALATLALARIGKRHRRGAACTATAALALVALPSPATFSSPTLSLATATAVSPATAAATSTAPIVRALRTTNESGLFRTEVDLVAPGCTASCAITRTTVWGGSMGGITQVIDHAPLPTLGQPLPSSSPSSSLSWRGAR